jgi:hypothetical protein
MSSIVAQSLFSLLFGGSGPARPSRRPVTVAERARVLDGIMLLLMPGGQF